MKSLKFFLVIVQVLWCAKNVNAINCYVCSSCRDPFVFNANQNETCSIGLDTCLKSTIRYPGGYMITKSCVPSSSCSETSISIAGFGFWLNCCHSDNCNSANTIRISSLILSAFLSVQLLLQ